MYAILKYPRVVRVADGTQIKIRTPSEIEPHWDIEKKKLIMLLYKNASEN